MCVLNWCEVKVSQIRTVIGASHHLAGKVSSQQSVSAKDSPIRVIQKSEKQTPLSLGSYYSGIVPRGVKTAKAGECM